LLKRDLYLRITRGYGIVISSAEMLLRHTNTKDGEKKTTPQFDSYIFYPVFSTTSQQERIASIFSTAPRKKHLFKAIWISEQV